MFEGQLKKHKVSSSDIAKAFNDGVISTSEWILISQIDEAKKEIFVAFNTSRVETWYKLKKWFGE